MLIEQNILCKKNTRLYRPKRHQGKMIRYIYVPIIATTQQWIPYTYLSYMYFRLLSWLHTTYNLDRGGHSSLRSESPKGGSKSNTASAFQWKLLRQLQNRCSNLPRTMLYRRCNSYEELCSTAHDNLLTFCCSCNGPLCRSPVPARPRKFLFYQVITSPRSNRTYLAPDRLRQPRPHIQNFARRGKGARL